MAAAVPIGQSSKENGGVIGGVVGGVAGGVAGGCISGNQELSRESSDDIQESKKAVSTGENDLLSIYDVSCQDGTSGRTKIRTWDLVVISDAL